MILRGLVGIILGLTYGGLVGVLMFLRTHIGLDREHPGPLIPNAIEMAWLITVMSGVITGISGALVGLVVGLAAVDKAKAAAIGFSFGLLVFALLSIDSWTGSGLRNFSWPDFVMFPIGLALVGVLVAVVVARIKPYDL